MGEKLTAVDSNVTWQPKVRAVQWLYNSSQLQWEALGHAAVVLGDS